MKNIFVAILFLSVTFGFGQKKIAVKKETVKKTITSPEATKSAVEDKNSKNIDYNRGVIVEKEAEFVTDEVTDYTQIFTSVQINAVPPGGMNAYRKYISTYVKTPEVDEDIKARVFLKFVVFEDGSLHDFKVIQEAPNDLGLGQEAIRVIKTAGNWTPGQMNGKNVKQYYTLPIMIEIHATEKEPVAVEEIKSKVVVTSIDKKTTEAVSDDTDYTQIFNAVTEPAQPNGGINAFRQYIATNFRMPAVSQTTTGTVIAKFVVWDDGSIQKIQIVKENPENLGLGKEAIRLLSGSEKWKPGKFNGRVVKQYFTLPIAIQIKPDNMFQPKKN